MFLKLDFGRETVKFVVDLKKKFHIRFIVVLIAKLEKNAT